MRKDEGRNQPKAEREKKRKIRPTSTKRLVRIGSQVGCPTNQWSKGGQDNEGGMIDGWEEK